MKSFPDISEYYKGEKAASEEKAWSVAGEAERKTHLRALDMAFKLFGHREVLELCCGTGWIPLSLPPHVGYTGVDNNVEFLALAHTKNAPGRLFFKGDIRAVSIPWLLNHGVGAPGIVCCFAALKHFGLHEWNDLFLSMLGLAPIAVFDVQLTPHDIDDGKEFHHVSVRKDRVDWLLAKAGRNIVHTERGFSGTLGDGVTPMEVLVMVTSSR